MTYKSYNFDQITWLAVLIASSAITTTCVVNSNQHLFLFREKFYLFPSFKSEGLELDPTGSYYKNIN